MFDDFYDEGFVLFFVYIMVIISFGVIFGILLWRLIKNYREVWWILGIFVLGILVWVVFCIVVMLGEYKMCDFVIVIGLLMNVIIMFVLGLLCRVYFFNSFDIKLEWEF